MQVDEFSKLFDAVNELMASSIVINDEEKIRLVKNKIASLQKQLNNQYVPHFDYFNWKLSRILDNKAKLNILNNAISSLELLTKSEEQMVELCKFDDGQFFVDAARLEDVLGGCYCERAIYYLKKSDFQKAKADFLNSLKLILASTSLMYANLSVCCVCSGNVNEAITYIKKAKVVNEEIDSMDEHYIGPDLDWMNTVETSLMQVKENKVKCPKSLDEWSDIFESNSTI